MVLMYFQTLSIETRGRILRERANNLTVDGGLSRKSGSMTGSVISRQPSFHRVSLGLVIPMVEGTLRVDGIAEEEDRASSDGDDPVLAELRARIVPLQDDNLAPAPISANQSPTFAASQRVNGHGSIPKESKTPCSRSNSKPPLPPRPIAVRTPSPPLLTQSSELASPQPSNGDFNPDALKGRASPAAAHRTDSLESREAAGFLSATSPGAAAGFVSATSPGARRMRASEGAHFPLSSPEGSSLPSASPGARRLSVFAPGTEGNGPQANGTRRMRASDGSAPLTEDFYLLRRQSNYNMIFSHEPRETVSNIIRRALASKYEVAFKMTGRSIFVEPHSTVH